MTLGRRHHETAPFNMSHICTHTHTHEHHTNVKAVTVKLCVTPEMFIIKFPTTQTRERLTQHSSTSTVGNHIWWDEMRIYNATVLATLH